MAFPGTVVIPIEFSGGLNSKVAEFSLQPPNVATADNAIYNKLGQIDTRTGLTAASQNILGGGTIVSGQAVTTFNNELLQLDGSTLYSYDGYNNIWINKGNLFSTINNQIRVTNTKIATQSDPDVDVLNQLQAFLYTDNRPSGSGAGIRYTLFDNTTNSQIVSDSLIYANGYNSKVIGVPSLNQFNIYYQASDNTIFLNTISATLPNVVSPFTQIITNGDLVPGTSYMAYDVVLTPFSGPLLPAVLYSAVDGLRVYVGGTSILLVPKPLSGPNQIQAISSCISKDNWWIVYSYHGGGTYVFNFDTTLITQIDSFSAIHIGAIEDIVSDNLNITYEIDPGNGDPHYLKNAVLGLNNYVAFNAGQQGAGLVSKPFKVNNQIFINTVVQKNLQATYFTQCVTSGFTAVAKHSPQNAGNYRAAPTLSQCDPDTNGVYTFAGQRKGAFTSFQNAQTVNLGVAGYTTQFNSLNAFNNVSANNNLHIVGGVKKIYDGISCVEDNFHFFPENVDGYGCTVTLINGGNLTYNPLTQPNSYQYLVVYEWTDNYGQVQRSGPSVPITVITTTTGQGAQLVIPCLNITDKINPRSPVSIAVYRTQDSLPIFYKITNDNDPLVNDVGANFVTYTDLQSDNDIAANENLYTASQLANTAPPACSLISLYQNRIFINSTEDPGVLWFSQNKFEQDQYNTLPLDWNTSFVEGVNSQLGNSITAIGLLDKSLAIFKKDSIFLLQGDGPNALDSNGQFNDASLLVADTGCEVPNSLVFITQTPNSPGGLMFKSPKGIYLLGRDQSIYYIGQQVEQYNNLTITSANLLARKNMVVFTTLEGTALVYNYYFNTWTTWSNLPAISATVWQDQLVILTPTGTVMIQDITDTIYVDTFADNVIQPVLRTVTTPWIYMTALQGYMCTYNCMVLGELLGPHVLEVKISYDRNPSIVDTVLINSNSAANRWGGLPIWGSPGPWGNTSFANYQFQVNFSNFKCQAVQLTFTTQVLEIDGVPQYNAAFTLNGLQLEALALPGPARLPAGNMMGANRFNR